MLRGMRNWAIVCLLLAAAGGCTPAPLYLKPGALAAGAPLTVLGFDFSQAELQDAHFRFDDLISGKVPQWNLNASQRLTEGLRLRFPATGVDLGVSTARNRTIPMEALAGGQPHGAPTVDQAARDAAPYVGGSGLGVVAVVDRVTKRGGVSARCVVLDRGSGEVVAMTQAAAAGGGWGVYLFYLEPLVEIAGRCARVLGHAAR
jgi:hypothetical protein